MVMEYAEIYITKGNLEREEGKYRGGGLIGNTEHEGAGGGGGGGGGGGWRCNSNRGVFERGRRECHFL